MCFVLTRMWPLDRSVNLIHVSDHSIGCFLHTQEHETACKTDYKKDMRHNLWHHYQPIRSQTQKYRYQNALIISQLALEKRIGSSVWKKTFKKPSKSTSPCLKFHIYNVSGTRNAGIDKKSLNSLFFDEKELWSWEWSSTHAQGSAFANSYFFLSF